MADKKITELLDLDTAAAPNDILTLVDVSEPLPANQNKRTTLTKLLAKITERITDKVLRFTAGTAPDLSNANEGALYYEAGRMWLSLDGADYEVIPRVIGSTGQVLTVDLAGDASGDPGFTFDAAALRLAVGRSSNAGFLRLFAGNAANRYVELVSGSPAATYRLLLPAALPTIPKQVLHVASIAGSDIQLGFGSALLNTPVRSTNVDTAWAPAADDLIFVDTSAGNRTITLNTPPSTGDRNLARIAKNSLADDNEVIVLPASGLIVGLADYRFTGVEGHGFAWDGTNWQLAY